MSVMPEQMAFANQGVALFVTVAGCGQLLAYALFRLTRRASPRAGFDAMRLCLI